MTVQYFAQQKKRSRVSSSATSTVREGSTSGAPPAAESPEPPPKKKPRPFPALGPIPPPPPRPTMPVVPERAITERPASKSSPSAFVLLSRRAQESGSSSRVLGTPPPPPPSQLPTRPVRSSCSDAPKKESVEEAPPEKTKRTRTAKHPRVNSKKIVERLQQEWSARVAALPASFRGTGPLPPLNAAQVNSLREEQEIQVRVPPLLVFLSFSTVC